MEFSGFKVIKRAGRKEGIVDFDLEKISVALTKAFIAVEGQEAANSDRVRDLTTHLANQIMEALRRKMPGGGNVQIEDIQDQVELALMRNEQQKVARAYVLYREERRKQREQNEKVSVKPGQIRVKRDDGSLVPLDEERMKVVIAEACEGLENTNADYIFNDTKRNLFDGIDYKEVAKAMVLSARALVETERSHARVAARLVLDDLRAEALGFMGIAAEATHHEMKKYYPVAFKTYIHKGIELELLDPKLADFDLERLGTALNYEHDHLFDYLGIQTLYDRYFIHYKETRFELPQVFFMRVAMGLALLEEDKNGRAIEFYELISNFDYMTATPTLFNSGTLRSQLSSCYLTTIPDDLYGIYGAMRDNAMLSKFAGGLGNDWTPVRAMNARIKGTNGRSQGVIPFLKVANDTAVAVNQGGKRKGAVCAYLETWHMDIEDFLELRKNSGDDRRRTHDMNTANWVPDLFMKRVCEDAAWTLFSPSDTPDLHDLYGEAFEKAYVAYEKLAAAGKIPHKTLPASTLWRKMLTMLFETGHPWITFKDPCNIRSPQGHVGVVHSSNLCTEITLNTSADEIAVCNLGSINLVAHLNEKGEILRDKLKKTIKTAIRMLDNVVDVNYYSVPQARKSNLRHRPVGLGVMGFQDALYVKRAPYDSKEAVEFADEIMEIIGYHAIECSSDLAGERGSYESFEGSLWSQGILPIDSIGLLQKSRGQYLQQDTSMRLDWNALRAKVRTQGMRNSNTMAIAPTATIANIVGVSQGIDPIYQNLYVKSNLSGEFTVLNDYLVKDLKKLGLWDEVMVNDLKYYNGSVKAIGRVPTELKRLYATAFEIDPSWLVEAGSRRQKWLDQAQSLNLYVAVPSGKVLDNLYKLAWKRGLKTTYYLRTMGATSTEKSTSNRTELNAVKMKDTEAPKACSIADPDCEACQ
jgi:ribonucleoside-diphosphate reductase alpha chain